MSSYDADEMYEPGTSLDESYGMTLLDDICEWLMSYVAFPSDHCGVAVTLWSAHTWLVGCFDSTPRLALLSPEKRCGKSRTLELLEMVCEGAETLSSASAPYLYRRIGAEDAEPVTILLDEADAIWKRGKGADESAEALRSIVDQGYRKAGKVGRVEMKGKTATPTRFGVYAPAAIAGIGNLPDTIMDRAVVLRMRRRAPGESVRRYRERIARPEGDKLRDRLAAWSDQVAPRIGDTWPEMPPGISDRAEEIWEPLIVIADLAGGAWPEFARAACVSLTSGARADDTMTISVQLLADIRALWGGTAGTPGTGLASTVPGVPGVPAAMSTEALLKLLRALDESPWGDWYGRPLEAIQLAKMLRPYEIRPTQIRIGEFKTRGYRFADFADAWKRYLPEESQ